MVASYFKGTFEVALCFTRIKVILEGFVHTDFGGCADSGKSTIGYVFTIISTTVSCMSRHQKNVAF